MFTTFSFTTQEPQYAGRLLGGKLSWDVHQCSFEVEEMTVVGKTEVKGKVERAE